MKVEEILCRCVPEDFLFNGLVLNDEEETTSLVKII
jgi:hypothetical protein